MEPDTGDTAKPERTLGMEFVREDKGICGEYLCTTMFFVDGKPVPSGRPYQGVAVDVSEETFVDLEQESGAAFARD